MTESANRPVQHTQRTLRTTLAYGVYEEHCWIARVLLVSDRSDNEFERCTLQVIEHLRNDSSMNTPKVGEMFEYMRQRDVMCSGVGRLTRD
jgi:hypothetical protein